MIFARILLLWLGVAALTGAATPANALAVAVEDARQLPDARLVRYLDLTGLSPGEGSAVVSFVANSLSHARTIAIPRRFAVNDVQLLAIDLARYVGTPEQVKTWVATWERMVERDPFWHVVTEVSNSKAPVVAHAAWVNPSHAAELERMTGSHGAIMRAAQFVVLASSTDQGFYHELADVPKQQVDWYKQFGVDVPTVTGVGGRVGASLLISGVTGKSRRVIRLQGPLGGVYATFDSAEETAARDFLRFPISADGSFHRDFDAGEFIAFGRNGLAKYALYDSKFVRQDSVPDTIAKDTSDVHGDGILQPMASCIRCHQNAGLIDFQDDFTQLGRQGVDLLSDNAALIDKAAAFYDRDALQAGMEFDRARYERACQRATGMSAIQIAAAFAKVYRSFQFTGVTHETAAIELGVPVAQFDEQASTSTDPILLALWLGRTVTREQWHASVSEAALLVMP